MDGERSRWTIRLCHRLNSLLLCYIASTRHSRQSSLFVASFAVLARRILTSTGCAKKNCAASLFCLQRSCYHKFVKYFLRYNLFYSVSAMLPSFNTILSNCRVVFNRCAFYGPSECVNLTLSLLLLTITYASRMFNIFMI